MRKTMRIAGIFLAIMMLFTLTSCTPKTAEKGKEKINKEIASLKDFKVKRSGKILVFGNKKAVNDYTGL